MYIHHKEKKHKHSKEQHTVTKIQKNANREASHSLIIQYAHKVIIVT